MTFFPPSLNPMVDGTGYFFSNSGNPNSNVCGEKNVLRRKSVKVQRKSVFYVFMWNFCQNPVKKTV